MIKGLGGVFDPLEPLYREIWGFLLKIRVLGSEVFLNFKALENISGDIIRLSQVLSPPRRRRKRLPKLELVDAN